MRLSHFTAIPILLALLWAPGARADDEAPPPSAAKAPLTVEVTDLRNRRGDLRLGVFTSPKGFPRERDAAVLWKTLPAKSETTVFVVDELPVGRYAIVVLHDENSNKKLDTNFLGIPREGYGVSNNPKPKRRAATFAEALFTLPEEGTNIAVSIQYF